MARTRRIFSLQGSVDKHVKRVLAIAQEIGRASADEHAITRGGSSLNHSLHHRHHAVRVERIEFTHRQTSLEAASEEYLQETVEERITSLFTLCRHGVVYLCQARDLGGQRLIPQLPSEAVRKLPGDGCATAAVFAFNGNDFDQVFPKHPRSDPGETCDLYGAWVADC